MGIFETFTLALKNVLGSKMRSFLTMLGIIIGVCAVIAIAGLGNGMTAYMREEFEAFGANTLTVSIMGTAKDVSVDDMYGLVSDNSEYLENISPTIDIWVNMRIGTEESESAYIEGISEDYFSMKGYEIALGRGLQYMDIKERKNVCVIGMYPALVYFGSPENAIGQTVSVSGTKLKIVGVMAQEADELEESSADDYLYLPYSTATKILRSSNVSSYTITITDEDYASEAKSAVEEYLYDIFRDNEAYSVVSMTELLDMMTSMINIMIYILSFIAGISLVVGGIGIMNIMLVSVTERTREIGIRKALGAKEGVILRQFVMESSIIAVIGGLLGIAAGYGLSAIATKLIYLAFEENLKVIPSANSIALAVGVSAGIGVLFGFLPAKKAARLNPIDALRYE